ncbi:MAG TPA: hypothetical protein VJ765_01680 [Chitinophagaceae bacterium]|nr:hypothetical protein [Chitinophagaceae bacterium]
MKKAHLLSTVIPLIIVCNTVGQTVMIPSTLDRWDTIGAKLGQETYMGKECLIFQSGAIVAKGIELRDGIIEADISFPQQRAFPGILFRMQDRFNSELFYVRPHQSGNPDATQYTPVFNGNAGWQLYHGEGYTKAIAFKFDKWHHIKIDLHGLQAEIYIDDMQTPLIRVAELLTGWKGGKFGFTSDGVLFRVANVRYAVKQGSVPEAIAVPVNGAGGVITQWQVANPIDRRLFEKKYELTKEIKDKLKWTRQTSQASGTVNLGKYIQPRDTGKAIIAKAIIHSETEQVKRISFGFSDYVTVYLNDKAVYRGNDNFMSRDYRFLGTVGFFDALFLPLKKGDNELWFVVWEDFGGWGVKAKFENMEGISLK